MVSTRIQDFGNEMFSGKGIWNSQERSNGLECEQPPRPHWEVDLRLPSRFAAVTDDPGAGSPYTTIQEHAAWPSRSSMAPWPTRSHPQASLNGISSSMLETNDLVSGLHAAPVPYTTAQEDPDWSFRSRMAPWPVRSHPQSSSQSIETKSKASVWLDMLDLNAEPVPYRPDIFDHDLSRLIDDSQAAAVQEYELDQILPSQLIQDMDTKCLEPPVAPGLWT
eukprot:gnl/TRDRNA2_/TRDRNA2_87139_c1_seq1.p1 gnl/TRDRNA2_/TRDRNA2_87139_c1~~gnl/TRDRNA2_/TRDRNA2_87139_c1_seq1.p1  ORF type:complete len:259 (-),score=39.93 gnl/TRDRNA2_/TRDRNA2_87139_c1_seq1:116-778(-)